MAAVAGVRAPRQAPPGASSPWRPRVPALVAWVVRVTAVLAVGAIVGVADRARELGVRRVSLNFAVFRSVFERGSRVGAGPVLRLQYRVLLLSRWWQIESLYRANAKYQPQWVPRFVCFHRAADLPRVAVAAAEAEAFIQWPRLRWLQE